MNEPQTTVLEDASGYLRRVLAFSTMTILMTLVWAGVARAETFTVTNTSNSGAGSLREAVTKADSAAGADEVVFAEGVGGTIMSSEMWITDAAGLTIDGGGDITVSGNHTVRVFFVRGGAALSLRGITVADGSSRYDEDGGGILNYGTLEVTNSTVSGNSTLGGEGGGVYNIGQVTVSDSTFSGNVGSGITNRRGMVKVTDSTFSGNGVPLVNHEDGVLKVIDSTFSDNGIGVYNDSGTATLTGTMVSGSLGYGIFNNYLGTLEVTNSTITGNGTLDAEGVGIYNQSGQATATNTTVSGNSGGGVVNYHGAVALSNTIVADNPGARNCFVFNGELTDGGYNVDDDGTCGFSRATGSLPDTDPLLDPVGLQDNGGPTPTVALLPDSPAVDLVAEDACPPPATDQRGVERPQGEACDSGAFELEQQAEPKTKSDCKKGGYREFDFENQGQCIASLQRTVTEKGRGQ